MKKRWMKSLWVGMVLMLAMPLGAQALQLVYPADGALITKSNYVIIKAGKEPLIDGITIDINGVDSDVIDISAPEYKQIFADMLILMPDLDPGLNKIIVRGLSGSKLVATVDAEVYYTANPWDLPPDRFQPFVMHVPEQEKLCAPCHNMAPSPQELENPDPRRNPCYSCHKRLLARKHVHGPAGVLECTACHSTTSKPQKYLIEGDGNELCLECHEDSFDDFLAKEYTHGPVETGNCLVCHSPHASDEFAQVRGSINALCLACHESFSDGRHIVSGVGGNIHPISGIPDPSRTKRNLDCTSCHGPHGGQVQQYLVNDITDRFVLCQYCHKK